MGNKAKMMHFVWKYPVRCKIIIQIHLYNKFLILVTQNVTSVIKLTAMYTIRGYIQKFPDWANNEINNNKHSLRSNTESYDGKTH